jgi:hypothetical protein
MEKTSHPASERESQIEPSSPALICPILFALLVGLLGCSYDDQAAITEPKAVPDL